MDTKPFKSEHTAGDVLTSEQAPGCQILIGDATEKLKTLPAESHRCCVTSPPYWGLRDYEVASQLGSEENLEDYVDHLVAIFEQVARVLTPDGTLWLNMGDSYTSGNRAWRAPDKKNPARAMGYRPPTPEGLKPKDLVGVPWRVAFALQAAGWYLRSDIIWYKTNCQPESVKDRPTQAHEHLFLLTRSEKYFYDREQIREQTTDRNGVRNRRSVWAINTEAYAGAHFATFPPALVEPCILAGSATGEAVLDPFFGSGTTGVVALELGRVFTGIELKPEYAELACRRLQWASLAVAS